MYNHNIFSNVFLKIYCKTEHLQKQSQDVFYKKATLKNFAIFTGKPPQDLQLY